MHKQSQSSNSKFGIIFQKLSEAVPLQAFYKHTHICSDLFSCLYALFNKVSSLCYMSDSKYYCNY